MAREAIQTVKFQVLAKLFHAQKSLESALLHLRHILEPHVIGDERRHLADLIARKTQAVRDRRCHLYTLLHLTVEADSPRPTENSLLSDLLPQRPHPPRPAMSFSPFLHPC